MSLERWKESGWLRDHETSAEEISSLMALVERDLSDAAREEISTDGDSISPTMQACNLRRQSYMLPDIALAGAKANIIELFKPCL